MYNEDFITRLTELRVQKGVSARDMSLSLGQNAGYINNIENGKALPSMSVFFYICEYFEIEPRDFFKEKPKKSRAYAEIVENLKCLDDEQFNNISSIIKALAKAKDS